MMQFVKQPGPFCRDCGTATYRRMTVESALIGWFGIVSMVANPITMLMNIAPARRIRALPAPIPGSPRRPLDPGKPIYRRAGILGLLIPIVGLSVLVFAGSKAEERSASGAEVGDCVVNRHGNRENDNNPDVERVDCADPSAQGKVIAKVATGLGSTSADIVCRKYPTTEFVYTTDTFTLCLSSPR